VRKALRKRTIAADSGSRPSGMRRPRRLPSPVRRPPAETSASAEYASFLLVPPPHCCGCRHSRLCDALAERGLTTCPAPANIRSAPPTAGSMRSGEGDSTTAVARPPCSPRRWSRAGTP
jgi:hypothetical protein